MSKKNLLTIVWPAFLVACLLEALVFVLFDPFDAHWLGQPISLSRQGIYTLSFFAFWALSALSSGLTLWLFSGAEGRVS